MSEAITIDPVVRVRPSVNEGHGRCFFGVVEESMTNLMARYKYCD